MTKLWQKAGGGSLDPEVEAFLSSLDIDSRLVREDIECSIAHARMLGRRGILAEGEASALAAGLQGMLADIASGGLKVDPRSEDIHSFIEEELTRRLGETGKAIHAGRSRNDQVAAAFRLHVKRAFARAESLLLDAMDAVLSLASKHTRNLMPGYTHLQRAQPVTLAHHLLAWCAALERDFSRFSDGERRADECPLGSGALAGSSLPVDREMTASELGFARPTRNTMDGVADRDACVDYAHAASSLLMHLSRACEDIALWVSSEYSFMGLSDEASTGSSIMPQKRNPDPAELIRGKASRCFGALQSLLVLQKGLSYAYNRDLQEDKSLFFDCESTVEGSLKAFRALAGALRPNAAAMRKAVDTGFLEATDAADYLVRQGLPFRTAYGVAKEMVSWCIAKGRRLGELDQAELGAFHGLFLSPSFDLGAFREYLAPESCVARRNQTGGPAPERTEEEIARLASFVSSKKAEISRGVPPPAAGGGPKLSR